MSILIFLFLSPSSSPGRQHAHLCSFRLLLPQIQAKASIQGHVSSFSSCHVGPTGARGEETGAQRAAGASSPLTSVPFCLASGTTRTLSSCLFVQHSIPELCQGLHKSTAVFKSQQRTEIQAQNRCWLPSLSWKLHVASLVFKNNNKKTNKKITNQKNP